MTAVAAAALGVLAMLNLAAQSCCAAMPLEPASCHGNGEPPSAPPDKPTACHATSGCAEHRKLRNIP